MKFIAVCGTWHICNSFMSFCKHFVSSKAKLLQKGNNFYSYVLTGKYAKNIISKLYLGSNVYLDRKYKLATNIISDKTPIYN